MRCVEIMDRIARRVEAGDSEPSRARYACVTNEKQKLVKAAVDLADSIEGASIIVFTQRGVLAGYTAWFRPQKAQVFAFCPEPGITRALHLNRAICPFVMAFDPANRKESIPKAVAILKRKRLIRDGAPLVIISDVISTESAMDSIVVQRA